MLQRCELASSSADEKSSQANADEADEEPPRPQKRKGQGPGKPKKKKEDKEEEEEPKVLKKPAKKDEYEGLFDDMIKDGDDEQDDPDNEGAEDGPTRKNKSSKKTHKKKEKTEPLFMIWFNFGWCGQCIFSVVYYLLFVFCLFMFVWQVLN